MFGLKRKSCIYEGVIVNLLGNDLIVDMFHKKNTVETIKVPYTDNLDFIPRGKRVLVANTPTGYFII